VVNQTYENDINKIVESMTVDISWKKLVENILRYIKENDKYYINALSIRGQNSFYEFFFEYTFSLNKKVVMSRIDNIVLSNELLYAIDFYSYGCVCMAIQWLEDKARNSPDYIAQMYYECIPFKLAKYYP